jgi:hypothetical protein
MATKIRRPRSSLVTVRPGAFPMVHVPVLAAEPDCA